MNNLLNTLKNQINSELIEFGLEGDVEFHISKLEQCDLQINNLVRYKNNPQFDEITKKIIAILNAENIFKKIELNEKGFLNLSFNTEILVNKVSNSREEFKIENPKKY